MKPERWRQIKELLNETLDAEPHARLSFLRERCGADEELCREVRSLLASHEQVGDFIEEPAVQFSEAVFDGLLDEARAGEQIGHYKILREVGSGGMGTVYLAERTDEFRLRVALKIVKRGMDTDFVLRRFRRERRVLAALDHTNIARLFDGGATASGLPYIVMEFIEGQPVDSYCDERRLSIAERLNLFRDVCSAIAYAHGKLVVHCDVKPSNILVTPEGVPKLLDFGIAKILDPALTGEVIERTATAMRLVTPEYASPEQVSGDSVTTASDIYSLGVLLYLLLAGVRPYDFRTRQSEEIARVIGSQQPERPSLRLTRSAREETGDGLTAKITTEEAAHRRATTPERLRQILAEDLDNIVLKALRKEPERRYSTVEALSDDIRRHLEGLPVSARADTIRYRSRKFVRRHRAGVAASSLIALSLCGGVATTLWQSRIAGLERTRAEAGETRARSRFDELRRLTESLMFELYDEIGDAPAAVPARALLAKRTVEYLDSLTREAADDAILQSELVIAYINLGDVQGNPFYPNMGDPAAALASYKQAAEIAEILARSPASDASVRRRWWRTQLKLADMSAFFGDKEAAMRYFNAAQNIIENLVATRPDDKSLRHDLGNTYDRRGNLLLQNGDAASAIESYTHAKEIFEQLSNADEQNDQLRRDLANGYGKIGDALLVTGDARSALENYQRQVDINTERLAAQPSYVLLRYAVASNWGTLGDAQERLGARTDALQSFRRQLAAYDELAAVDPKNAKVNEGISLAKKRIARLLARRR